MSHDDTEDSQQPPSHLGARAKAVWAATLEDKPRGWLTEARRPILASYCQAVERQESYERKHAEYREQYPDDFSEMAKIEKQVARAERTVRMTSDKLGLKGRNALAKSKQKSKYLPPHLSLNRRGQRVPYLSEDPELYLSAVAALEGTERSERALRSQVLRLAQCS
jgi:phage terminase small subunit